MINRLPIFFYLSLSLTRFVHTIITYRERERERERERWMDGNRSIDLPSACKWASEATSSGDHKSAIEWYLIVLWLYIRVTELSAYSIKKLASDRRAKHVYIISELHQHIGYSCLQLKYHETATRSFIWVIALRIPIFGSLAACLVVHITYNKPKYIYEEKKINKPSGGLGFGVWVRYGLC